VLPGAPACPANFGCRQVLIDTQIPVMGGVAVPATIAGGSDIPFASSATDNLDLATYDYTLNIPTVAGTPAGNPLAGGNVPIRSPATATNGQTIGTAFDNVLTTNQPFNVIVPKFIRNLATTTAGGAPQNNGVIPNQITVRAYDAAGNTSTPVIQPISPINIPQSGVLNYVAAQPSGAAMLSFAIGNAAVNISNGAATPVNPTTVNLFAQLIGSEGPTFQYINPFTQVQFYYYDPTVGTGEFILIGSVGASTVTDNATVTQRTFTYNLTWDPPASLGTGAAANVLAIGVNATGDALSTAVNNQIQLTNP
jgi:hypothetical protein